MNLPKNKIICGHVVEELKKFPPDSIDCIVFSPPYYRQRNYLGPESKWRDPPYSCRLGWEPTVQGYVFHMVEVFEGLHRVLKPKGNLWINIGETYGGNNSVASFGGRAGYGTKREGVIQKGKSKSCCLVPERLLIALTDSQGWYVRNKIIWRKPASMPFSGKDRFQNQWEYIFFLTKNLKYFFNLNAVRVPHKTTLEEYTAKLPKSKDNKTNKQGGKGIIQSSTPEAIKRRFEKGKNPGDFWESCSGDVWKISTQASHIKHYAVMPPKLVQKMLKAGCPPKGIVLDPFNGSGSTCFVAKEMGLDYIGIDISLEYVEMAEQRLQGVKYQESL